MLYWILLIPAYLAFYILLALAVLFNLESSLCVQAAVKIGTEMNRLGIRSGIIEKERY